MQLEEYLHSLETFGIKLGLLQTTELMTRAGYCPEPGKKPYFIHLAGSNGKGSTGAMLQKALCNANFKTGFYTSPHLASFNERFRINGEMISDDELEEEFQKLLPHAEAMRKEGKFVTYFEFTTVLALGYFLHQSTDFVIWETGMGGRFDSTNVVIPAVSVITNIALEHCQYLGDTLGKIAFEKGGIIKENVPVFCGIMPDEALSVLKGIAAEKNAPFNAVYEDFTPAEQKKRNILKTPSGEVELALYGSMQRRNFTLVYHVLQYLSSAFQIDFSDMLNAMKHVSWPGRLQLLPDGTVLDGGHNPDGINALVEGLTELFPNEKFSFVFASFEDKDTRKCLEQLIPAANDFTFVPLGCDFRPSCPPERLQKMLSKLDGNFKNIKLCNSLKQVLDNEKNTCRRVICGSLYLLGEYFSCCGNDILKKI